MKEKFQPKKLGLLESDFENSGRRKDFFSGREYNLFAIEKNKLVPKDEESELLNENMTTEDWMKVAMITCGDNSPRPTKTHFVFETSYEVSELIDLMEHNYSNHQFVRHFGSRLTYDEILELYNEYTDLFDDVYKDRGIRISRWYNEEKHDIVAKELGLERIAYGSIWSHPNLYDKQKLSIGDIYYINFLPKDYGGYPVFIYVDRSDMCRLSASTNARVPNIKCSYIDKGENDYKRVFTMQEPQRWKIGKLTDKKRIAWMEYIEAYFKGLEKFCDERSDAFEEAQKRLLNAGFLKTDSYNFYKTAEDCFRCKAKVSDDGKIYTTLEVTDQSKIMEKYFKY